MLMESRHIIPTFHIKYRDKDVLADPDLTNAMIGPTRTDFFWQMKHSTLIRKVLFLLTVCARTNIKVAFNC